MNVTNKFKSPFGRIMTLLLLCILFSCEMEEMTPVFPEEQLQSVDEENGFELIEMFDSKMNMRLGPWNMIFEETFEGEEPFYAYADKQLAAEHSFTVSTNPSLRGEKSGRFELRKDDPQATENGKRAEIMFPRPDQQNLWYSFGLHLPSNGFAKDRDNDVLSQWHQAGQGSPPTSFRIMNDRFIFRIVKSDNDREDIDLGPATKDTWNNFVFHIIHSYDSDGLIEIWNNDKKLFSRNGRNIYKAELPNWKIGIYKPSWEKSYTDSKLRIAYFDNVRIGNEKSVYEEMLPSNDNTIGWGPDVPDINSLTLINGSTNKAVKEIFDGEIINRNLLNTERVSIRAEIAEGFGGSVQFDLKGPLTNLYWDNGAPFALFGDDSQGKYYHLGGLPLGDYTLTVTPFDERAAKGKAGNPKTIRFKVINEKVTDVSVPTITGFTLIKANINQKFGSLSDGDVLSLAEIGTHKLTVEANLSGTLKGEVRFELSGQVNRVYSANAAPYTIYGYKDGDYKFGSTGLPAGNYQLKATPVLIENGTIVYGVSETIQFRVVKDVVEEVVENLVDFTQSTSLVEGFTLIKANTNTEWGKISDGSKFYANELGTYKLTIRADLISSFQGRVLFELSGSAERTSFSGSAPYTLNNYKDGNYSFGNGLYPGNYTLKVTPYYQESGGEVSGIPRTVKFQIL